MACLCDGVLGQRKHAKFFWANFRLASVGVGTSLGILCCDGVMERFEEVWGAGGCVL